MVESYVSIAQYWPALRKAASGSGYLAILILLSRTGDAEEAYSDLRKLWVSFDNLTGEDIAFVVAGVQTDMPPEEGSFWGPSGHHYKTDGIRPLSRINSTRELCVGKSNCQQYPFRRQPKKPKANFSDANTAQISELCTVLGFSESDIPSLILDSLDDIQPSAIPIWHKNFYGQVKSFMAESEALRAQLRSANKILIEAEAKVRQASKVSVLAHEQLREYQRRAQVSLPGRLETLKLLVTESELPLSASKIAWQLLNEVESDVPDREDCFALLKELKSAGTRHRLIGEFNRAIDIALKTPSSLQEVFDIASAEADVLSAKQELTNVQRGQSVAAIRSRNLNLELHQCFRSACYLTVPKTKKASLPVLLLAANPQVINSLDLEEELREIQLELKAIKYREEIDLYIGLATRPDDLVRMLREYNPRIILFCGHGTEQGIVLRGDAGYHIVGGDALAQLLKGRGVDLIILNACYSNSQADSLADAVPAIIGTSSEVDDLAARKFSKTFFRTLGNGHTIQDAFRDGRDSVIIHGYKDVFSAQGDLMRTLCG